MQIRSDRRILLFAALLMAAIISWWLSMVSEPRRLLAPADERHDPDFYLKIFELTSMSEKGLPRHRLVADSMFHYPDDDTAVIHMPRLTFYQDGNNVWEIKADEGLAIDGGKRLKLIGPVFIQRKSGDDTQLKIFTSDVLVTADSEVAETKNPVKIYQDNGITYAVGMKVDFKNRKLDLLADVRGEYVIQSD